jgi:hypothetical protein
MKLRVSRVLQLQCQHMKKRSNSYGHLYLQHLIYNKHMLLSFQYDNITDK